MSTATLPRAVIPVPAKSLVRGLQVTSDVPDGSGGYRPAAPATITDIKPYDGGRLLLILDNGLRVPFDLEQPVAMVCAPTDHPVWCADPAECERQRDADGSIYHGAQHHGVDVRDAETSRDETLLVGISRVDDPDGAQGSTTVHILAMGGVSADLDMPPGPARELGRLLIAAADQAEPQHDVSAQDVRLGDELLTPAGWQTVTGILADGPRAEVSLYTINEEEPVDRYDLDEPVTIRREVTR